MLISILLGLAAILASIAVYLIIMIIFFDDKDDNQRPSSGGGSGISPEGTSRAAVIATVASII